MNNTLIHEQSNEPLVNYVRIHRRRVGLSQRELGRVLGYGSEDAVARHERFRSLPPFLIGLGYEIVFQLPVSEIFPGLKQTLAFGIEQRLTEFETELRMQADTGSGNATVARKLEWLSERRSSGYK
jgi:DNA-binding XRE family transcriptional regulator